MKALTWLIGILFTFSSIWIYTLYLAVTHGGLSLIGAVRSVYPWDCFSWGFKLRHLHPWVLSGCVGVLILNVAAALVLWGRFRRATQVPHKDATLHGDARFANYHDAKAQGLLEGAPTAGVVLGKLGRKYLLHKTDEHMIVYAPTRAGKGVSIIVPTLLTWKESAVVLDIKGELSAITASYRQFGLDNNCLRLDFSDPTGAKFNPLEEVRLGTPEETRDIANIVEALFQPDGNLPITYWERSASIFLIGFALHALYKIRKEQNERITSLGEIASMINEPSTSLKTRLQDMLSYEHTSKGPHPEVVTRARMMLDKEERELSGVKGTLDAYIAPFLEPLTAEVTGSSSFSVAELMQSPKPVSLYIVVPPEDLKRLAPVVRITLDIITARSMRKLSFENGRPIRQARHKLLLLLDEFPAIGRLPQFESALAYLAGYGVQALIVAQDRSQIFGRYGKDESITANCHVRVAFAPNDLSTAQWLSSMCGSTTRIHTNVRHSGKRRELNLQGVSRDLSHTKRPLLTPEEIMRLPGLRKDAKGNVTAPGQMLCFVGSSYPFRLSQAPYFLDSHFTKRLEVQRQEGRACISV